MITSSLIYPIYLSYNSSYRLVNYVGIFSFGHKIGGFLSWQAIYFAWILKKNWGSLQNNFFL